MHISKLWRTYYIFHNVYSFLAKVKHHGWNTKHKSLSLADAKQSRKTGLRDLLVNCSFTLDWSKTRLCNSNVGRDTVAIPKPLLGFKLTQKWVQYPAY